MKKLKLQYIGFSFHHHGEHSGYDQIRKHIPYDDVFDCQRSFNLLIRIQNLQNFISRRYFQFFGHRLWWIELRLILQSIIFPEKYIYHFIYGENIFKHLAKFKRRNQVVLTLHQPPSYFEAKERNSFMRGLAKVDKIIVMSEEMQTYFLGRLPDVEVKFIPHGVDTNYYSLGSRQSNTILMVGNWLRDFNFAAKVFSIINKNNSEISISVLTDIANHKYFANCSLELLSGISDQELINLYQRSKLLFLPLKQFTANNAILEACSCGCQVVVSTPPKNISYTSESPIVFLEFSENFVANKLLKLLEDFNEDVSESSRQYIKENFNWPVIGKITQDFITNSNSKRF